MKQLLRRAAALWIAAVLFSLSAAAAPPLSARCAVLLDAATGRVLYEHHAEQRALVASTTKIMTGLLVAETCTLDAPVEIPPEAVAVEGSSMSLEAGAVLRVETLLYGLLLHSGNDAATALAIYCAGSVENFAVLMNQRARDLGLEHTHFVNPHGLDAEDHYSTALDLAKLAAAAMENPIFRQVVSTKNATLEGRCFTNHNKLLWQYDGADGVKTGYTKAAGRILVSSAVRDGRRLIAVTIDDPNDWADHVALLDYGFSRFSMRTVAEAGAVLGVVPVIGGAEEQAQVVLAADAALPVAEDERVSVSMDLPVFVYAPVLAGDQAGVLRIMIDGAEAAAVPVYWRNSVLEGT